MLVPRTGLVAVVAALLILTLGAACADASRTPTRAESSAIKKAFFRVHDRSTTTVTRIRVSTIDKRFSAVTYRKNLPDGQVTARAAKVYRPAPVILRKGAGGKWKAIPTAKAPKQIKNDLGAKSPRSDIRVTGDVNATLTRAARCTPGDGSASIYDPASDLWLSIQFPQDNWKGPGIYPALSVKSLAGLYTSQGTVLQWETGQGNNAEDPSGLIYADGVSGGVIEASMARIPDESTYPQTVFLSGTWACG